MTTVVKLGGSVITAKDDRETLDDRSLRRAAEAIAGTDDVVVVHGAGSFGHPQATDHGVSETVGTHDTDAVTEIHGAVTTLTQFVVSRLHAERVSAVPVHPLSAGHRDADGETQLPVEPVETLLDEDFCPVTHGDGIAHAGEGVSILSGDEIVTRLAGGLDADRVGLCSAVPGVLDEDGEVIDRITAFEEVAATLDAPDGADVTGGMAGKVQSLLALDAPAFVFGLDDLPEFLAGHDAGTRID